MPTLNTADKLTTPQRVARLNHLTKTYPEAEEFNIVNEQVHAKNAGGSWYYLGEFVGKGKHFHIELP
jgi:hypothetical protein